MGTAYRQVMAQVEGNPQLRMKQVQEGQNTVAIQLSAEDAVRELPQWREFVLQHEKKYREAMANLIEKLGVEVK